MSKLGLCLAGGGVKGAAHIGAIKAFEEKNIKFDYVAGTSSGSIVAALYALGYSSDEMYELFKKYSKKIKYIDWQNILKIIFGVIFKRKLIIDGLNSGKVIEKAVNEACMKKGIENISEVKMPLIIPTVNLQNGELYVFSSKQVRKTYSDKITYLNNIQIGKAVRASCSYPVVMSPCKYKDTQLVDGGIRENMAWKEVKQMGADKVLGISFENAIKENCCENVVEIAIRSLDLVCHELSNYEVDGIDYLLKIPSKKVSLLDVSKIEEMYEKGYETTKKEMKNYSHLFCE